MLANLSNIRTRTNFISHLDSGDFCRLPINFVQTDCNQIRTDRNQLTLYGHKYFFIFLKKKQSANKKNMKITQHLNS